MIPSRIIGRKRDGEALTGEELRGFLAGYLEDEVSDAQMASFLMAVQLRGLSAAELDVLVDAMLHSGAVLDLSHLPGPVVDKHSTGGVGDKVSLVLAPVAAELGLHVPMMSGRGLGHTGGTLDKLESIPGFRTDLSLDAFRGVLEEVGCAMIGQTTEIAPLDRRLYELRSVTGTVPSIPLIASSIMSKKLAEGLDGLVLDVKLGAGAFLPEPERARALARTMVRIGDARRVETVALCTAMDRPLGRAVGNALEVREALECLAGGGPADVDEVVASLVGEMLAVGGLAETPLEGRERALDVLERGGGRERMGRLVEAQGGDPRVVDEPDRLPRAPETGTADAPRSGVVTRIDPVALGYGVVRLGGGRRSLGASVDPRVGFVLRVGLGDRVAEGAPLAEVHAASPGDVELGRRIVREAVTVAGEAGERPLPLIGERIDDAVVGDQSPSSTV